MREAGDNRNMGDGGGGGGMGEISERRDGKSWWGVCQ